MNRGFKLRDSELGLLVDKEEVRAVQRAQASHPESITMPPAATPAAGETAGIALGGTDVAADAQMPPALASVAGATADDISNDDANGGELDEQQSHAPS